jgi:hypothetical protein
MLWWVSIKLIQCSPQKSKCKSSVNRPTLAQRLEVKGVHARFYLMNKLQLWTPVHSSHDVLLRSGREKPRPQAYKHDVRVSEYRFRRRRVKRYTHPPVRPPAASAAPYSLLPTYYYNIVQSVGPNCVIVKRAGYRLICDIHRRSPPTFHAKENQCWISILKKMRTFFKSMIHTLPFGRHT